MLNLVNMLRNWRSLSVAAGLSWFMKLLMVIMLPVELYKGDYLFSVLLVLSVVLSLIPSIVEKSYKVTLPFELDFLITFSIFLNTFMGEGLDFYQRVWFYDKALHVYGSAVFGLLAFVAVYTLKYTRKIRLSLPFVGFFTVIFTMALGGLWEIMEFGVDNLFDKTTQDSLDDTMWDLINDLLGGFITAAIGMLYVKYSNPDARKRLARPLGEVFGLGNRIDRLRKRFERPSKRKRARKKGANGSDEGRRQGG